MNKNILFTLLGLNMALLLISSSTFGSSPDSNTQAKGPSDERIARHALGRADLAERMGLCFEDQASTLRQVANQLLHAKTQKERVTFRASVKAAHDALSACLDLSPQKCAKKCTPLPPAAVSNSSPETGSASLPRDGVIRTKIVAVDNGSIREDKAGAGTVDMRSELNMGMAGKKLTLRTCYRIALKRDPNLAGMAAYRLVFGADGKVRKAHILSTTLANLSLAKCALKPLRALHLSAKKIPSGATAIIRLVFTTSQ